jgi:hypothetical protein
MNDDLVDDGRVERDISGHRVTAGQGGFNVDDTAYISFSYTSTSSAHPRGTFKIDINIIEMNTTAGLCGDYNNDVNDDFITSTGAAAYTGDAFAIGWQTNDDET